MGKKKVRVLHQGKEKFISEHLAKDANFISEHGITVMPEPVKPQPQKAAEPEKEKLEPSKEESKSEDSDSVQIKPIEECTEEFLREATGIKDKRKKHQALYDAYVKMNTK